MMKNMLGKIHLKWCKNCNLPIIDKKCNICGEEPFDVKITPPGDARPAFERDLNLIRETLEKQFGVNEDIFKNKVVLLNKAPGIEYMREIILDGQVFGILRFDEKDYSWKIIPTIEGARRIINVGGTKKIISISEEVVPYILNKGASVLRPGVKYASEDIEKNDDVIILVEKNNNGSSNNDSNKYTDLDVLGVGRARMSYDEILDSEKGMVAKVRKAEMPKKANILNEVGEDAIEKMVKANNDVIERFESNSVGFMRNTIKRIKRPCVIAYSGGKDSLIVLLLALKAFRDCEEPVKFDVLFTDTGIEFPETLENVELIEKTYNIKIHKAESREFWEKVREYGPPGRDYRWCSEVCKMKPLEKIINEKYENGCLTFVGLRKYESINRSKKPRIWNSPHIKKQMLSAPILNWSTMHVWIYLFKNKAPYNVLYESCFDRVGCFMCPAMDIGEIDLIKRGYPQLWQKWEEFLKEWAEKENLGEDWIKGGWRWKYKNKKTNNRNKDSDPFEI